MTRRQLDLTIGTMSRAELREALDAQGVGLNASAETLLAHECFDDPSPEAVRIVILPVADLDLSGSAPLAQILAAASERGFAPCRPDTGPALRLALTDQDSAPDAIMSAGRSPSGAITVGSLPLSTEDSYPKGFYLRVVGGRPWLRGYRCDAGYRFSGEDLFAFALPAG